MIAGPTASGKSALAVEVAEAIGGTVINADALQIYRDLTILTARPGPADLARAPHRLYGVLDGRDPCSAARWRAMALDAMAEAARPILVGGTGFYLSALIDGLVELPDVPEAARAAAEARRAALGAEAFHAEVAELDPDLARARPSGDRQRLVRAWAVATATGRPLTRWQAEPPLRPPPDLAFHRLWLDPPRAELYRAIDDRARRMVEAGALDEVRPLAGLDPALPIMKAVGVRELLDLLAGRIDAGTALARLQQASRRYAKRQTTWFRHRFAGAHRVAAQYSCALRPEIFSFLRRSGLTGPHGLA